jgi:hypothetical protein
MTTRDERLLALKTAVDEWADREEQRYEDEVAFLESVRDGLSSSGSVSRSTTGEASALTQDEIDEFLSS